MTTTERAVDTVLGAWTPTEQTPLPTAMARAWIGELAAPVYPLATVVTEVEMTPKELVGAAIWVVLAAIVTGLAGVGLYTLISLWG